MKRFLFVSGLLLFLAIGGFYLVYAEGYYYNFTTSDKVTAPFYTEGDMIYQAGDESKTPFIIKGVEVDSAYGPKRGTDYSIEEETWKRWFKQIQQMGANTIRVSTVQDSKFYNAFYEYNLDREVPLYLLQGMRTATDDWKTNRVTENLPFYQVLQQDGKDLVDIIHGRKLLLTNDHKGSGLYKHDVSPWVIGFLIGDYWNQDLLAYIDNTQSREKGFTGDYVTASDEATEFEALMAKVIDNIISYETDKYANQRLVSVNSSFAMDPFQYQEHYSIQVGKYNNFFMDSVLPSAKFTAGTFASYAYDSEDIPDPEMLVEDENYLFSDSSNYLELLSQVHNIPVIISSFSYPSSSYINENDDQGTMIVNDLEKFSESGFNGAFIHSWQDVWDRRAPETSYAVDLQQIHEWHDAVTRTQHFGLIGFQPYRDGVLMSIDGKNEDWQNVTPSFKERETEISVTRDHGYIYFWIKDANISENEDIYIALDTHPELGSKTNNITEAKFDRKMDFIVEIQPDKGAFVYVQDRYESIRQNFLEQVSGENPFVNYPQKDSDSFQISKYLKEENKFLSETEINQGKKLYNYLFAEMYPLKVLKEKSFGEADVAVLSGVMEIRLPYQLLNIYDPLKFSIHDDYYSNYGVAPLKINEFYISFSSGGSKPLNSIKIPVEKLNLSIQVKEFKKLSYEQVKAHWRGGN